MLRVFLGSHKVLLVSIEVNIVPPCRAVKCTGRDPIVQRSLFRKSALGGLGRP
jgi:hypothetical protein